MEHIIDNDESGVFCPSNKEPVGTCEVVKQIAKCHNKKIVFVPGFGWALRILSHFTPLVNKAFGNMEYDKDIIDGYDYCLYSMVESVKEIEKEQQ